LPAWKVDSMGAIERVKHHWSIIVEQATSRHLDPFLLAAVACQESECNPMATRVEPDFEWIPEPEEMFVPRGCNKTTEFWHRKTSWGAWQMMGQVLRELGFNALFPLICHDMHLAAHYAAKFLEGKIKWATDKGGWRHEKDPVRAALLRYNGGGYRAYPDKVLEWRDKIAEAITATA